MILSRGERVTLSRRERVSLSRGERVILSRESVVLSRRERVILSREDGEGSRADRDPGSVGSGFFAVFAAQNDTLLANANR